MGNVMIDYDIYLASLKLLIEISRLLRYSDVSGNMEEEEWRKPPSRIRRRPDLRTSASGHRAAETIRKIL